jgi:transglutaminase-like putative cysteine protease
MTDLPPPPPADEDLEPPPPGTGDLAYKAPCRYCRAEVFVARCDDGHWRTFDPADADPTTEGVFVWHNRHGMQEYARFGRPPQPGEQLVPGKRLHYCAERTAARLRLNATL